MNQNAAAEFARIMQEMGVPLQNLVSSLTFIHVGPMMVRFHPGCTRQGCACGNGPFLTIDILDSPMAICDPADCDRLVDMLQEARRRQWGERPVTTPEMVHGGTDEF